MNQNDEQKVWRDSQTLLSFFSDEFYADESPPPDVACILRRTLPLFSFFDAETGDGEGREVKAAFLRLIDRVRLDDNDASKWIFDPRQNAYGWTILHSVLGEDAIPDHEILEALIQTYPVAFRAQNDQGFEPWMLTYRPISHMYRTDYMYPEEFDNLDNGEAEEVSRRLDTAVVNVLHVLIPLLSEKDRHRAVSSDGRRLLDHALTWNFSGPVELLRREGFLSSNEVT